MSFAIFEENNYYGLDSSNSFDIIPLFALIISIIAIFFSFKIISSTKRIDIQHKKFLDLCLNPVTSELDRLLTHLDSNKNSLVSSQIGFINSYSREFSMLLVRIRKIYKLIDVSKIQDEYNDFSDKCLNQGNSAITSSIIDDYQILRITIINQIYDQAMPNILSKNKIFRFFQ